MTKYKYILKPGQGPDRPLDPALAGGKAAALALLAASPWGAKIPPWFALSKDAFLDSEALWDLDRASVEIPAGSLPLHPAVSLELAEAISELAGSHPDALFAVRSSAVGEDGPEASYAGQLASVLDVKAQDVPMAVQVVWASALAGSVARYREHALEGGAQKTEHPLTPAVLVQVMVPARAAGVGFSADPVSGSRERMVISACRGLGDRLVSGEVDGDTYYCDLKGTLKDQKTESRPVLNAAMVKRVADLLRDMQEFFGVPQDVEWAFAEQDGQDDLFLLQSRPITTLKDAGPAPGLKSASDFSGNSKILWDNSNIVESYSGVTSPLTFSFARYIYEHVYIEFCRFMGVSERRISARHDLFRNMLGSINGHVYYNLLNWYKWLTLFPGFSLNRRFMEQMMGVGEELPEEFLQGLVNPSPALGEKILDALRLARSGLGLVVNNFLLERKIKAFQRRLNEAFSAPASDFEHMPLDRLAREYRLLEEKLLRAWDAPLINDFLCMIAFGASRKLLQKYGAEAGIAYHQDMLIGQGDIISAEPARRIRQMAKLAAEIPELVPVLQKGDKDQCFKAVEAHPTLNALVAAYLDRFGDRCLQELKLESPTMADEPGTLFSSIGHLAARWDEVGRLDFTDQIQQPLDEVIGKGRWRNFITMRAALWAKKLVRNRENLRFERTRLFGRVRKLFVRMGENLRRLDALDDARDVFYLRIEEVLGLVEGTASTLDVRSLVRARKAEYEKFRELPDPPSRLVTRGAVFASVTSIVREREDREDSSAQAESMQGTGCCRGEVKARVRVILDPRDAELESGEIMVARFTDPGWITLFANAAGILIERGSLLSHSAIVARELNIPAIVGLKGVTAWLKTGDLVEMDGASGVVRKAEGPEA